MGFSTRTSIPRSSSQHPTLGMLDRGHGNAGGIHSPRKRIQPREDAGREFFRHAPRAIRIGIDDADQLHTLDLAIDPRVVAAEIARTHNRHANR